MKKLIFPIIVLILVGIIARHEQSKYSVQLPILGKAPVFSLENSTGGSTKTADLADNVWVAHFFFTSCQGPCPITSANMELVSSKFVNSDDVRIVSITMDPENDNADALNNFAAKHHASQSRWHFLRGDSATTRDLLDNGFSVGSHDDLHFHTTRVVLVDRLGQIRGYYQATERSSIDKLITDISKLLGEEKSDK